MEDPKEYVRQVLTTNPDYFERISCDLKPWTAPFKCAVSSCKNSFKKYVRPGESGSLPYKFHNFPEDEEQRKIWLEKCSLPDNIKVDNLKVCSDHFLFTQYSRNYKEEFRNPKYRRPLIVNAVPTEKLDGIPIPVFLEPKICTELNMEEVKLEVDANEALRKQLDELNTKEKELRTFLQNKRKSHEQSKIQLNTIKHIYLNESKNNKGSPNIISKIFSEAQISILKGDKRTYWSEDDLAKGFTIRHMSNKRCYLYLKNTLNIPLPALSCVQKWATSRFKKN